MAKRIRTDAGSYAPPPEAVAFAFALVKSTPAHMSARDYALELRSHLKRGQQPSGLEHSRYIDLVGYWQQRCHQLTQENEKLKTRNSMLERANQLRENQFGNEEAQKSDQTIATNSAKRKRAAPKSRKSTHTKAAEPTEVSPEVSLEEDLNLVEGLEEGLLVMKHTWSFQKLLRQPDADPRAVCSSLVGMASSLGNVVHNLARACAKPINRSWQRQGLPTLAEDRSECARALAACGRIFGMLLTGLERLNNDGPGKHLSERVIYECVKMFSVTLSAIETSARQSAIKSIQSKADESRESLSGRLVAHYLTGLIGFLEQDNVIHQKLFDGFTFTLLERVSKQLYHCVFGQHRGATIAEDIRSTISSEQSNSKKEAERMANRFEMKALVVILERALSRAPGHMNPQPISRSQSMNPRAPTRSRALSMVNLPGKGRLSPIAKDRLQRTLITCMYGDKIEDDFMDLLTGPVDLGTIPNMPKVVDQSVEEWYQEQIWKLVGWDIMAQESSWLKRGTDSIRT
ncbi:hypothetical protein DM02DRAFT_668916 [Periconia macrospinosa]|uniref:Uncharacterized protein n=1 Tax=Periconia macrospinosa TaxID=97972 RepID=A0A2V1E2D3_9PLEO|nr:hypothetical protein DM02DRAFT_668916 [Periconia macrospinosa]